MIRSSCRILMRSRRSWVSWGDSVRSPGGRIGYWLIFSYEIAGPFGSARCVFRPCAPGAVNEGKGYDEGHGSDI